MLKNFLKIAYRNLNKYKYYSIINILSFAFGLAVFATAYLYAMDELSYDRFHKNSDRIYRVVNVYEKDSTKNAYAVNPFPMSKALKQEFPGYIDKSCRIFNFQNNYHLVEFHEKRFIERNFFYADPEIFDIFDFQFSAGNPKDVLDQPNTIIISESLKKKYFGDYSPIGKEIIVDDVFPLVINGVFKDFPEQSHIHFDILTSSATIFEFLKEPENWLWNSCWTYVLLKENVKPETLSKKFPDFVKKYHDEAIKDYTSIYLQPLTDIHLKSDLESEVEQNSKSLYIYILITISLFLLFVSWLNFVNLSVVGSITRVREVSIRKIMGSSRHTIVFQFITEAVLLSLLSFLTSLFLIEALLPVYRLSTGHELQIDRIMDIADIFKLLAFSILAGIIIGIYTGIYASSFPVFNIGRFKNLLISKKWFTGKILILVQYIISLILLIGVLINFKQLVFLKSASPGFDKEKTIVLPVKGNPIATEYEKFKSIVLENKDIESVTAIDNVIGAQRSKYRYFYIDKGIKKAQFLPEIFVRHDFVKTLGIEIINGSDFLKGSTEDVTTSSDELIINEILVKQLGYQSNEDAINKKLFSFKGNERIVGVIKNFNTRSLHTPVSPLVIRLIPNNFDAEEYTNYVIIKYKNQITKQNIKFLANQWNRIAPNWPFEYQLLDKVLDQQYHDEETLNFFLWIFSILLIIIASMGVWAISSLITIQKTKEIGIRKAIGASITDIIYLFIKDFLIILVLANIIAWPISWLMINKWFENFISHVPLQVQYFIFAALALISLTLTIIIRHAFVVASSDTVESLRDE